MNNEWTEETVRPYMFKMIEVSDDGKDWNLQKLMGYFPDSDQPFSNCGCCSGYRYMRPIVEKKTIVEPWTFETCPWPLSVKSKTAKIAQTAWTKDKLFVYIHGRCLDYCDLLEEYEMLDGTPCGIVREVDA